jgi:hypothetical protein
MQSIASVDEVEVLGLIYDEKYSDNEDFLFHKSMHEVLKKNKNNDKFIIPIEVNSNFNDPLVLLQPIPEKNSTYSTLKKKDTASHKQKPKGEETFSSKVKKENLTEDIVPLVPESCIDIDKLNNRARKEANTQPTHPTLMYYSSDNITLTRDRSLRKLNKVKRVSAEAALENEFVNDVYFAKGKMISTSLRNFQDVINKKASTQRTTTLHALKLQGMVNILINF